MPDKSKVPCKKCGHAKKFHKMDSILCFACEGQRVSEFCKYVPLDNLKYLEWCYNENRKE